MRIRVLRGFADYRKGQVFENWPDGMCELLIRRGVIERLEEPAETETADAAPDAVERAEMPSRKKKR